MGTWPSALARVCGCAFVVGFGGCLLGFGGCLLENPLFDGPVTAGDATDGGHETQTSASDGADTGETSDESTGGGSTESSTGLEESGTGATDETSSSGGAEQTFCDLADPDLVACYEFEKIETGEVRDGSMYANHGTAAKVAAEVGLQGTALATSPGSEVRIPNHPSLKLTDALTVELWVRPKIVVGGGFKHIVDKDRHYTVGFATDGKLRCRIPSGIMESEFVVPENEWTHLACTYDGTSLVLYADGVAVESAVRDNYVHGIDEDFMLGGSSDGDWPYTGRIDQVRVWRYARSEVEICEAAGTC